MVNFFDRSTVIKPITAAIQPTLSFHGTMVGILVWTSVAVMYLHMRKLLRTRTISTGKSKKGGITATDKEKSLMNILKYLPAVLLKLSQTSGL